MVATPGRTGVSTPHLRLRPLNLRVLLVEDHADSRRLLGRLLESYGCSVRSAGTVAGALELADHEPFDVLISDIGLPDGDGWELMRRLKPRPRYAIAMSGLGMSGDRARSREVGFRHHLVKPTGPEQLAQILEDAQRELKREPEHIA